MFKKIKEWFCGPNYAILRYEQIVEQFNKQNKDIVSEEEVSTFIDIIIKKVDKEYTLIKNNKPVYNEFVIIDDDRRWAIYKSFIDEELLNYRYNRAVNALQFVDDISKKLIITILDNQLQYIKENSVVESYLTIELYVETIYKIYNNILKLRGLIGIQPGNAPVGLVYKLVPTFIDDKKMLDVKGFTFECFSRKFQTVISLEVIRDLQWGLNQLDILSELSAILAAELSFEIMNELIYNVYNVAKTNTIKSTLKELAFNIDVAALNIKCNTQRGSGNYILTDGDGWNNLKKHCSKNLTINNEGFGYDGIELVGTIGDIQIYVIVNNSTLNSDSYYTYIMSYGAESCIDNGLIFAPYIPIILGPTVINELTFELRRSLLTRYAIVSQDTDSNYYQVIKCRKSKRK